MGHLTINNVEKIIFVTRGLRVMLDSDLAELYGIDTKQLNQQVRRNIERFPADFMFQLSNEEYESLNLHHSNDRKGRGGKRKMPLVFTENGVAMLSSVLNSPRAIQINIEIMRIFTNLRSFLLLENELSSKVEKLEDDTKKLFKYVFKRLDKIEEDFQPILPSKRSKIGIKKD